MLGTIAPGIGDLENLINAKRYPDKTLWEKVHDAALKYLDDEKAITWQPKDFQPPRPEINLAAS